MRPRSERIVELDALRGLAAVAVVLFHYTTRYDQLFGHNSTPLLSMPEGHYGVDLFFMLSGFVILMTLDRTRSSLQFAWGRFSRLYPSYWCAAAVTFAVVSLCGLPGQEVTPAQALVNVTMIQSLLDTPHIDGAYWSLQAELIFYANMLLLYRLGAFRRVGVAVTTWVTIALAVYLVRPVVDQSWPVVGSLAGKIATIGSLQFIPLFGIGLVFYHWFRSGRLQSSDRFALAACLIATFSMHHAKAAVIDLLLAITLWLAVSGRAKWLGHPVLTWLGAISYTLYLTHQNIGYVIIREAESLGMPPSAAIGMATVTSLLLAQLLHRWVERPSLEKMRRIQWRRPAYRTELPVGSS